MICHKDKYQEWYVRKKLLLYAIVGDVVFLPRLYQLSISSQSSYY